MMEEAGRLLCVRGQHGTYSEFQVSQGYKMGPYLKNLKKKKKMAYKQV